MNTLIHGAMLSLFTVAVSGFAQSSAPSSPAVEVIAASYTNYQQITKSAVLVSPQLATLCVGVSKETVDADRKNFGPHANTAILIFMNDAAAGAFQTNAPVFPVGSVVVKQKTILGYTDQDGKRVTGDNGVGGMVKRPPGFDPKHGDWEYFYFENPKKIESGRIASCVQCHESAKDKDYVFGSWRKTGG